MVTDKTTETNAEAVTAIEAQLEKLSLDQLLDLQAIINEQLRQRVGSKNNGNGQAATEPITAPTEATTKINNQNEPIMDEGLIQQLRNKGLIKPKLTKEEVQANLRKMFTPEELAAAEELDMEAIAKKLNKPLSNYLIAERGE